jgi:hypothetical protein
MKFTMNNVSMYVKRLLAKALQCPCHERGNVKHGPAYWSDIEYHCRNWEGNLKIMDNGIPAKGQ